MANTLSPQITAFDGNMAVAVTPETMSLIMVDQADVLNVADGMSAFRFNNNVPQGTKTLNMTAISSTPFANQAKVAGCTWDPFTNSTVVSNSLTLCDRQAQFEQCSDEFKTGYSQFLSPDGRGFADRGAALEFILRLLDNYSRNTVDSLMLTVTLGNFWTTDEFEEMTLGNGFPIELKENIVATLRGCEGWVTQVCNLAADDETRYGHLNRTDLITTSTDFENDGATLKSDVAVDVLKALYTSGPAVLKTMLNGTHIASDGTRSAPVFLISEGFNEALLDWVAKQEGTTNDYGMVVKVKTINVNGYPIDVPMYRNVPCLMVKHFDTLNHYRTDARTYICYLTVMGNVQFAARFNADSGGDALNFTIWGKNDPERYGKIQGAGYYSLAGGVASFDAMTGVVHEEPLV